MMKRLLFLLSLSSILLAACGSAATPSAEATLQSANGTIHGPTPAETAEEASPTPQEPGRQQARVVQVIDGDTIEVEIDGQVRTVRYLGVDCPEPDSDMGIVATDINRALVERRTVELEMDESDADEYGRLLRYVYVGGVLVNAELVRLGYAHAVTLSPDLAHADEFLQLEQTARLQGQGIWGLEGSEPPAPPTPLPGRGPAVPPIPTLVPPTSSPAPASPTTPPAAAANVVVNPDCCQFDSPGDDNFSKEEEYVCLTTSGGQAADMTGWYLCDEYGWGYTFPPFTLAPGATVRVRTGCGTNSTTDLYWCKDETAVWNNGGDTVLLFDAQGNQVAQYSY
jgi:micrococcal nuclease